MRRRKRRTKFNKIWSGGHKNCLRNQTKLVKVSQPVDPNENRLQVNICNILLGGSSLRFTGLLLWEFLLCVHIVDSTSHTWLGAYSYDSRTQDRFERTCSNASNGRRTVASPTHLWRKAKYEEVPMVQLHKGLSLHNPLKKSDCYQKKTTFVEILHHRHRDEIQSKSKE